MPYTITAFAEGATLRQTRTLPASAAVLAMRWTDDGHSEVRITADDKVYSLDSFRQRLWRAKHAWRQRARIHTLSSVS